MSGHNDDREAEKRYDEERRGERVREAGEPERNGERLEHVERLHQLLHEQNRERREAHVHPVRPEALALRRDLPGGQAARESVQRLASHVAATKRNQTNLLTVLCKSTALSSIWPHVMKRKSELRADL